LENIETIIIFSYIRSATINTKLPLVTFCSISLLQDFLVVYWQPNYLHQSQLSLANYALKFRHVTTVSLHVGCERLVLCATDVRSTSVRVVSYSLWPSHCCRNNGNHRTDTCLRRSRINNAASCRWVRLASWSLSILAHGTLKSLQKLLRKLYLSTIIQILNTIFLFLSYFIFKLLYV